jgi:5'-3' exonuclease
MRVHLIDGTYELFRAWFGAPAVEAPDGREVGATRSLARQLLTLIRDEQATHVAVAFDHTVESFRNEIFDGYKTSDGLEPELLGQFELAEQVTAALGLVVWPMVEFEADDALATGAVRFAEDERVDQVRIHTPDKDLAQCVSRQRIVRVDRLRNTVLDEAAVVEKFGVAPVSIPDWLALVGDDADGLPGLPGWGAKSSATVLAEYGHIEQIPADPGHWSVRVRGAARLADTLNSRREEALLYRTLATLRLDVPLQEELDDLAWRGARHAELRRVCQAIGDEALGDRVRVLEEERAGLDWRTT